MNTELENKDLTSNDAKPVLGEVISAEKIITNILTMYNLDAVEQEMGLKIELAKEILKDLKHANFLK